MLDEVQQQRKHKFQQHAELVRMQTCSLMNNTRKLEDQLKPKELWQFDWDLSASQNTEESNLTDQEIKANNTRLATMLK